MLEAEHFLEERYPNFVRRHQRVSGTLAKCLAFLFCEKRLGQFAQSYPHLEGFDFVDQVLRFLDFNLRLTDRDRQRIPASGRVVIAANHPIGSLDGLALLHLVRQVRPDVRVVANELLTAIKPLAPVLLPVNNMGGNTPRENLRNIRRHLEDDGALIIFPAGEVSRFGPKGVKDGTWQTGFVKIAKKTHSPILPVWVDGRNSAFFYSLSFLARPLSTAWLVREMFKQRHNTVDVRIGNPVIHEHFSTLDVSAQKLAAMFRKHVYRLGKNGRPIFQSVETVAHPENRLLLKRELLASTHLGDSPDGKQIFLCRMEQAPCVMREIGRLRELTFRAVGEGTGLPRDIDRFDKDYVQLVLWDPADMEIAGAYRLAEAGKLLKWKGWDALYTNTLFRFDDSARDILEQGLELGRSFVQPRYQNRNSLDYLWVGIGAFLKKYPGYRYLFGPASISPYYGAEATARLAHFYSEHYPAKSFGVTPRRPLSLSAEEKHQLDLAQNTGDSDKDLRALKDFLASKGLAIPTLYKHYTAAMEPGGVTFAAFNIDPDFGNCVDGLIVADIQKLKTKKRIRYLGTDTSMRTFQGESCDHGSTET